MAQFFQEAKGWNEQRRQAVINHISFNTHFNRNFNLISLMSAAGGMKDQIQILFDHGITYVVDKIDGELVSPLHYAAHTFDDQDLVDVFVHHLGKDVQRYDNKYVIEFFHNGWKDNFTFRDASFSGSEQGMEGHYISGHVKPGNEIFYSTERYITPQDLKKIIDFDCHDHHKLVVQTLRIQLNFQFNTALGIEYLQLIDD